MISGDTVALRTSVVIATHNYGRFLAAALHSVLGQAGPAPELIVVDDGSSDETSSVVARFPSVHYLRQCHRGVSTARNWGAAEASGEWLYFLDADDQLMPGAIESLAAFLAGHADVDAVAGWGQCMDVSGVPLPEASRVLPGPLTPSQIVRGSSPITGAALVRRSAFERVGGFDEGLSLAEDLDFWIRLAAAGGRIVGLDRPVLRVRVHGGSASAHAEKMARQIESLCERWSASVEDTSALTATRLYTHIMLAAVRWESRDHVGWRAALLEPSIEASNAWESPHTFLRLAYQLLPRGWRDPSVLRSRSAEVAHGLEDALAILGSGPSHTPRRAAAGLLAVAQVCDAAGRHAPARRALLGAAAVCPRAFATGGGAPLLLKSLLPRWVLNEMRRVREALRRPRPAAACDV